MAIDRPSAETTPRVEPPRPARDEALAEGADTLGRVDRIVMTADFMRAERRLGAPTEPFQQGNLDWIGRLVGDVIGDVSGLPVTQYLGEVPGRRNDYLDLYDKLGMPADLGSWAAIYEGMHALDEIEERCLSHYENSLVVGFECPPYLVRILSRNGIPFIDFAIHPLRFLNDYVLGIRSNVRQISARLAATRLPEQYLYDSARILAAGSARVGRGARPLKCSALFLGQMGSDASLIIDGRMASLGDVENALIDLTATYELVYYKKHPHCKNVEELQNLVWGVPRVQWIEENVYDLFATGGFDLISTLSSGSVKEAKYWRLKTHRYLQGYDPFDEQSSLLPAHWRYLPIGTQSMVADYWRYLMGESDSFDAERYLPSPFAGAIKSSLNMKWGR